MHLPMQMPSTMAKSARSSLQALQAHQCFSKGTALSFGAASQIARTAAGLAVQDVHERMPGNMTLTGRLNAGDGAQLDSHGLEAPTRVEAAVSNQNGAASLQGCSFQNRSGLFSQAGELMLKSLNADELEEWCLATGKLCRSALTQEGTCKGLKSCMWVWSDCLVVCTCNSLFECFLAQERSRYWRLSDLFAVLQPVSAWPLISIKQMLQLCEGRNTLQAKAHVGQSTSGAGCIMTKCGLAVLMLLLNCKMVLGLLSGESFSSSWLVKHHWAVAPSS